MPTEGPYLWAAFDSNPGDAEYKWTDLTDYIRDNDGGPAYSSRRGRQAVTQKFNTGRGTFYLDNRKLTFEALNTGGPYYGKLDPMVPVQFGLDYPWLPGQVPNGDMRKNPNWVVGAACTVTWVPPAAKSLLKGTVNMVATSTSVCYAFTDLFQVPASKVGTTLSCSARMRNNTGSSTTAYLAVYFFSDAAGTAFISSGVSSVNTVSAGQIASHRVAITIPAGTVSCKLVPAVNTPINTGSYSWWATVADYTATSLFDAIFTGYSDSWDCNWDIGDALCTLQCSDAFKAVGLSPLSTPLYGTYLATLGARNWYRLNETVPTQSQVLGLAFKDQISGLKDASVWSWNNGTVKAYYGVGPLAGIAGSAPVDNDLGFSFVGPSSSDGGAIWLSKANTIPNTVSSASWSVAFWFRSTNGVPPRNIIPVVGAAGTGDYPILWMDEGARAAARNLSVWISGYGTVSALATERTTTKGSGQSNILSATAITPIGQNVVVDTLWHRIWVTYNGSTNVLKVYIDGLLDHTETQISATPAAAPDPIWSTTIAYFGFPYSSGQELRVGGPVAFAEVDELMFFDSEIAAGTVTTDYFKAKLVYAIQRSTERFSAVLDNISWPAALRVVDNAKGVQVTDVRVPFYQANPLAYLQQVEDSEVGMMFVDKRGRVNFIDVNTMETASSIYSASQATFGTGSGETKYEAVTTTNDDDTLGTHGKATREGGAVQTYDAPTITAYLFRSVERSNLLLDSDEKVYNVIEYITQAFSRPGTKLTGLTFNPYENETTLTTFMSLELGMAVTVRLRPPGITPGTYFEVLTSVQAINVDKSRNKCRCTLSLSDIYVQRWMQFGDNYDTYNMGI